MHARQAKALLTRKGFCAIFSTVNTLMFSASIWIIALLMPQAARAEPLVARNGEVLARVTAAGRPSPQAEERVAPSEAPPEFGLADGQSLRAIFRTTLGTIECTLETERSPRTIQAFVALANGTRGWTEPQSGEETTRPLYENTLIHRVIPGFLIQGGDPTGTGTGGPGFTIPDENTAGAVFDQPGVLGLATRGPHTGGSQFFITAGPARHLDGRFTRMGTCTNLGVLTTIAAVPRNERNRPVRDVILRGVEVVAK